MNIIKVTNLNKKYDKFTVLNDVSFNVKEGAFLLF